MEIDRDLIPELEERFGKNSRFRLMQGDIVKVNLSSHWGGRFKVVGNLPYNISGAIFEWLIGNFKFVELAVITVQKEVANRVKAKPGSRDYGSLSVLVQMFYSVSRLFDIPAGCFSPKPKVTSTVIRLSPDLRLEGEIDYLSFREFIYSCFAQKRKTLVNSLKASGKYEKHNIEKCLVSLGKSTDIRAEQLNGRDFSVLYRKITGNV